jgi:hypothetical protein
MPVYNMLANANPDELNAVKNCKRKYIYPEMLGRTYNVKLIDCYRF